MFVEDYLRLFRKSVNDFTVVFSQGNSGDIGGALSLILLFSVFFNVNVITYDYIGYGISTGMPTEPKFYEDLECVMAFTVNKLKIPLEKIFLWGYSLGSGPTVDLASRY